MLSVLFYLACVGLFITLSMFGPLAIALFAGETAQALRFGFYILLGGFVFGAPVLALIGRLQLIPQIGKLILVLLVWTVLPFASSIIIYDMSDLSYVDSLFETFSGFTTTGSTTLNTVEIWPQSLLFWRVQTQWLGGFMTLLTIIMVIAPMGVGGLSARSSAFTVGADFRASQDRLAVFVFNLALLYSLTTVICFFGFFITGTRAFYAATMAMTATSTGGFLPFDDSLDQIIGPMGQAIFAVFLIVGATSVFWHRMVLKGQFYGLVRHRESYSVIALIIIIALTFTLLAIAAVGLNAQSPIVFLIQGLLNAASLVATSGIQSQPGYFTLLPLVVILFIILVGGSAFSTSGGLKHYRIGAMVVQSWSELDRLVYPNMIQPSHFGSQRFDINLMKAIWGFFVAAILTLMFGTLVISASGLPFEAALTATIAAFSTAGPIYSAGWSHAVSGAWPAYSAFPDAAKLGLVAIMLLGRLEVIAIIGLLSTRYWRSR